VKANELRPCDVCKQPLMAGGHITFHKITFERMSVNMRAVNDRVGLSMVLGNNALAEVFAPIADIADRIGDADSLLMCEDCAMKEYLPMVLAEAAAKRS
jgi:hypothetical protein